MESDRAFVEEFAERVAFNEANGGYELETFLTINADRLLALARKWLEAEQVLRLLRPGFYATAHYGESEDDRLHSKEAMELIDAALKGTPDAQP